MDERTQAIVDKTKKLDRKKDKDPLYSFINQGEQIYLSERKFDNDTGVEVSPLLTSVKPEDVNAYMADLQAQIDQIKAIQPQIDAAVQAVADFKTALANQVLEQGGPPVIP